MAIDNYYEFYFLYSVNCDKVRNLCNTITCTILYNSFYFNQHMHYNFVRIYPYICFDYLLAIIRGIKVYKHRLHIHYSSWFTFNVKTR
jgi:hypothetical protein